MSRRYKITQIHNTPTHKMPSCYIFVSSSFIRVHICNIYILNAEFMLTAHTLIVSKPHLCGTFNPYTSCVVKLTEQDNKKMGMMELLTYKRQFNCSAVEKFRRYRLKSRRL